MPELLARFVGRPEMKEAFEEISSFVMVLWLGWAADTGSAAIGIRLRTDACQATVPCDRPKGSEDSQEGSREGSFAQWTPSALHISISERCQRKWPATRRTAITIGNQRVSQMTRWRSEAAGRRGFLFANEDESVSADPFLIRPSELVSSVANGPMLR